MSQSHQHLHLDSEQIANIEGFDLEQRYRYLLKEAVQHQQIWILTDEHGCVMLNTDEDDGVPVWPHESFAQAWATGEWKDCTPQAISLHKWHKDWTPGLHDDDLVIVVFPSANNEGMVLLPDEFDHDLRKTERKKHK